MGGMISQELALLAPHRVQSLALCVTHAGGITAVPPVRPPSVPFALFFF